MDFHIFLKTYVSLSNDYSQEPLDSAKESKTDKITSVSKKKIC